MRVQTDAESSKPHRPGVTEEAAHLPATAAGRPRFRWRAVIHAGQKLDPARGLQPVAWHLAECDDPPRTKAHCDIGRHLIATDGNPDGHCFVNGVCPRCPSAVEE
jgi:hypothetical protein